MLCAHSGVVERQMAGSAWLAANTGTVREGGLRGFRPRMLFFQAEPFYPARKGPSCSVGVLAKGWEPGGQAKPRASQVLLPHSLHLRH